MFETNYNKIPMLEGDYLKGRTVFITGGTKGIGFCMARQFLKNMASVIITGITQNEVDTAITQMQEYVREDNIACGIVMDNRKIELIEGYLTEACSMIGNRKIDILVNNAGINSEEKFGSITPDEFDEVISVNLKGTFFISQMFAKYMVENEIQGNILNVASSSSLRPAVNPYTLSKWGIRGLTIGLAKTLVQYGITVNAIAPGPTATDMMKFNGYDGTSLQFDTAPTGRLITPDEVANVATFLVSEMGRMILGDVVFVSGGAGVITYDDLSYDIEL